MNYAESFEQFSSRIGPTDLLLYAGAGIIFYVLFQDKLGPVKSFVQKLFAKGESSAAKVLTLAATKPAVKDDLFFELVSSWKTTRDLAVKNNCPEAVKVADQMFPYLSPSGCGQNGEVK